ncbi:MAG: hypothetical protein HY390_03810 [Deltaproteobacteria bacterium]|nr:hypothetical protein [Deltaproteobacteria bacterium]
MGVGKQLYKYYYYYALGAMVVLYANAASVSASGDESRRSSQELIEGGIRYLVDHQNRQGCWEEKQYPTAFAALAGLAILGAGHTPHRGPYREALQNVTDCLMSAQRSDGLFVMTHYELEIKPMFGHGFALLFLNQIYGMDPNPQIETAIKEAIGLLVKTQHASGGWNYTPAAWEAEFAVSIVQIQALLASTKNGFVIPAVTFDQAIHFMDRARRNQGGFQYHITGKDDKVSFDITAAGLLIDLWAQQFNVNKFHERTLSLLEQEDHFKEILSLQGNVLFRHFYLVQVYHYFETEKKELYFESLKDRIYKDMRQTKPGHFYWQMLDLYDEGSVYATAMVLLILESIDGVLPLFESL